MSYKEMKFRLTGTAPLIPHNGQTADPLNQFSKMLKQVSSKRKKTDEDYKQMADIEWMAGMYLLEGMPAIPGELIEAMFVVGAKATKRGKQALAGMYCSGMFPLKYKGPQDLNKIKDDPAFRLTAPVRVQRNKVMRTRPRFDEWSVDVLMKVDPLVFNPKDVQDIMKYCGESVGLCDWRPKYGRFTVTEL